MGGHFDSQTPPSTAPDSLLLHPIEMHRSVPAGFAAGAMGA